MSMYLSEPIMTPIMTWQFHDEQWHLPTERGRTWANDTIPTYDNNNSWGPNCYSHYHQGTGRVLKSIFLCKDENTSRPEAELQKDDALHNMDPHRWIVWLENKPVCIWDGALYQMLPSVWVRAVPLHILICSLTWFPPTMQQENKSVQFGVEPARLLLVRVHMCDIWREMEACRRVSSVNSD